MVVRFRGLKVTVYRKTAKYSFYRIAFRADGRRVFRSFKTFSQAKAAAKAKVRELHQGNGVGASLTKGEANAFKFARLKLNELETHLNTSAATPPIRVSLEEVITEYCAAKRLLGVTALMEAVKGFLSTVARVERINLKAAVAKFLAERDARTKAEDGKRPALSPRMAYQDRLRMDRFTAAFGTSDVCDLRPDHLDLFFGTHLKDLSPRSRNHYRSSLSVFFKWCVRMLAVAQIKLSNYREQWRQLNKTASPDTEALKKVQQGLEQTARLVDGIATQLYFASGAFDDGKSKVEGRSSEAQLIRFWKEAKSLFAALSTELHPHTADYIVQTLHYLLPCAPREVFLAATKSICASADAGFHHDSLAVGNVVKLIQCVLADHNDIFRGIGSEESECLQSLVTVLDLFVEAGWPEARRLTHRLEEIYR